MYSVGEAPAAQAPTSEPHAAWEAAFSALHGSHTVTRPNAGFPVHELVWQRTDRFNLNWCGVQDYPDWSAPAGARQSIARAPRHVRTDPRGTFELLVPLRGSAVARIGDEAAELAVGAAALCDFDRPMHFSHGADFAALSLVVPQSEISARDTRLGEVTSVIDMTKGPGALVAHLARTLHDQRAHLQQQAFDVSCEGLVDLMCLAAAGANDAPLQHSDSVADTVRKYIRAHAVERNLDVRRIAHALGWSTRHIQAVLQECGTTARDLIRTERLHLAHTRLVSRTWRDASITDIAYASGFSTPSLFASAFRTEFAMTPTVARRAAADGDTGAEHADSPGVPAMGRPHR